MKIDEMKEPEIADNVKAYADPLVGNLYNPKYTSTGPDCDGFIVGDHLLQ